MATTKLIGWSVDEYKKWASDHAEGNKTVDLRCQTYDEVRVDFDSGPPKITGYASMFNNFYELFDGFFESVEKGAFTKTILNDDVRALFNHDPSLILARRSKEASTLILREDDKGLYYEFVVPDTTAGRDLLTNIKLKNITQSSFGFNIIEQTLKYDKEKDEVRRTLTEVKLFDVSPVTFPANPKTETQARMIEGKPGEGAELIIPEGIIPQTLSDEDLFREFEERKKIAF